MSRPRSPILLSGLCVLLALAGCSHRNCALRLIPYEDSGTIDSLPAVERGQVAPNVANVPGLDALDISFRRVVKPDYRSLTPAQAQCLAADESALGDLISNERSALQSSGGICHNNERAVAVMRRALGYAAAEARNQSAGDGLEAYFRLVEAEGLRDLSQQSGDTLRTAVGELGALRERGITIPPQAGELERQQVELDEQVVEGDLAIVRLNSTLSQLTGLRTNDEQQRFWPVAALNVEADPIDIELAVAEGLQMRPELNLLRYVERELDLETLPVARQVLGGVTGILGSTPEAKHCSLTMLATLLCGSGADEAELSARRRQLRQYRRDREQAVAAEIRQAVYTVETRVKQIAIAKRRLAEAQQEARDTEERQQAARANFAEVAASHLSATQAQADLVSAVVAWELARAQLREAQGMLIFECGGTTACP